MGGLGRFQSGDALSSLWLDRSVPKGTQSGQSGALTERSRVVIAVVIHGSSEATETTRLSGTTLAPALSAASRSRRPCPASPSTP